MYDFLMFASLIAGWFALNIWILPLFGISTCLCGTCRVPRSKQLIPPLTTDNRTRNTGSGT